MWGIPYFSFVHRVWKCGVSKNRRTRGKLINNLEATRSSHSLWDIASIRDCVFLLSESQEWIMNINESPEWLYEQRGIVHSLFTSFIMNSLLSTSALCLVFTAFQIWTCLPSFSLHYCMPAYLLCVTYQLPSNELWAKFAKSNSKAVISRS